MNSILRSFSYKPGQNILVTSIGYNAVRTTIQFLIDTYGVQVVTVPIVFPIDRQKILQVLKDAVEREKIDFAVLDHISSFPTIQMPLEDIIPLFRHHKIRTLIDGAHSLGQIPLNLKELDPDFYLANAHKWLCGAHGSAFLYVKKELQNLVHPAVISHFYNMGYQKSFAWTGTRDYTPMLAMSSALAFRSQIGDEEIGTYNNGLCRRVASFLFDRWNTTSIAPLEMMNSMINIPLPCNVPRPLCWNYDVESLQRKLEEKHNIWTFLRKVDGVNYVRISCQIYNAFDEFVRLANILEREVQN